MHNIETIPPNISFSKSFYVLSSELYINVILNHLQNLFVRFFSGVLIKICTNLFISYLSELFAVIKTAKEKMSTEIIYFTKVYSFKSIVFKTFKFGCLHHLFSLSVY